MKKIILSLAMIASVLAFTACSSDDDGDGDNGNGCSTCELNVLGTVIASEYCDNGDGTMDVTTEGATQTVNLEGQSFSAFISALEQAGATCQ